MKKGFFQSIKAKYRQFQQSAFAQKAGPVLKKTGYVLSLTSKWAYKLRSILLSIPVAVVALALAVRNLSQLPSEVCINLLSSSEYQWVISRGMAACVPLLITAVCLCMMFLSKKVLYPWLISVFSLALPLVLWLSNVFTA